MALLSKDFKVGLVFFIAVGVLVVFAISLGALSLVGRTYLYDADFDTVSGLDLGSDVLVHGTKVGTVASMKLVTAEDGKSIRVRTTLEVNRLLEFHQGYRIAVIDKTLIGGRAIEITLGDPGKPLYTGTLEGTSRANPFQAIGDLVERISPAEMSETLSALRSLLQSLTSGEGALAKILSDPKLGKEITESIHNTRLATWVLQELLKKMNDPESLFSRLAEDREMYDALKAALNNANLLSQRLLELTEGRFYRDFEQILSNVNEASRTLRALVDEAQKDPQVFIAGRPGGRTSWLIRQLRGDGSAPARPTAPDPRKIVPEK